MKMNTYTQQVVSSKHRDSHSNSLYGYAPVTLVLFTIHKMIVTESHATHKYTPSTADHSTYTAQHNR